MSHAKWLLPAALIVLAPCVRAQGRDAAETDPAEAVVLSMDREFKPVGWVEGNRNTDEYSVEQADGIVRMTIDQADMSKAFLCAFDVPIDAQRYPLLVLRYRAVDLPSSKRVVTWVDDGTGANSGGANVFRQQQLVADGEIHELRADLRELTFKGKVGPSGPISRLCLYFDSGDVTPAVFELHDLRFAAEQPGPAVEVDEPITFTLTDAQGNAVIGADVTLDDERANFARSGMTDDTGKATIVPMMNEASAHSVYVEADGYMPTRRKGIAGGETVEIVLPRAAILGGEVRNEQDEPIEGAKVEGQLLMDGLSGGLTYRRSFKAQTDAAGRWRSPAMPIDRGQITLRLSHPDYVNDRDYRSTDESPVEQLIDGNVVSVMSDKVRVIGFVVDAMDEAIAGATVRWGQDHRDTNGLVTQTDRWGRFFFERVPLGELPLTVQSPDYAPDMRRVTVTQDITMLRFELSLPHTIRGRVVDALGRPIPGARVEADTWRGCRALEWSTLTDDDGRFEWHGAPADEVQLNIAKDGYAAAHNRALRAGKHEYVIRLPHR